MATPIALATELLLRLAWSSAQACVLIGALALLLRLRPSLPAAMRSALWWLVGVQLVLGLLWARPLALPLLAPGAAPASSTPLAGMARPPDAAAPAIGFSAATLTTAPRATGQPRKPPAAERARWPLLLVVGWLAGLAWHARRTWQQWRLAQETRRHARRLEDDALHTRCRRQADALGLRRLPEFRLSEAIASPQVGGWLRPVVLLPPQALGQSEWDLAVAHELAHVARHDLWLGLVPALAQRLFFFHPAVRWAMREYAVNREAACDAQVLRQHPDAAHSYAQLLVRLGVSDPLHAGLAGASPTFVNLKRRLLMLQQSVNESNRRPHGWLLVALVALAGVLPYRVTARDSAMSHPVASPVTPAAAASVPAPAVAPTRPVRPAAPPPPPPPPSPPAALPLPPPPPPPPPPAPHGAGQQILQRDTHARSGFALFDGDNSIISGTDADADAAQRWHHGSAPLLWLRRANRAYVIRDPALVARAMAIYAPLTELARQQGMLAGRQGELAGQQAGLAARDAAFADRQQALAQRQAALAEYAATDARDAHGDPAVQARQAQQRALEQEQARLEQEQAAATGEVGAQQHALELRQAALEKQQQSLERRQQQVSQQATQSIEQLLEEALRSGKAQAADAA